MTNYIVQLKLHQNIYPSLSNISFVRSANVLLLAQRVTQLVFTYALHFTTLFLQHSRMDSFGYFWIYKHILLFWMYALSRLFISLKNYNCIQTEYGLHILLEHVYACSNTRNNQWWILLLLRWYSLILTTSDDRNLRCTVNERSLRRL